MSSTSALIGSFDAAEGVILRRALERASSDAVLSRTIAESQDALTRLRPRCICVDGDGSELATTAAWVREHPTLFSTPLIAMVSTLKDGTFVDAYRHGADDVVLRSNPAGVTRRVGNLQQFNPSIRPPISKGRVFLCHYSDSYRRVLGRVLRHAGFEAQFGVDFDELADAIASEHPPELIVAADDLLSRGDINQLRNWEPVIDIPFIIVTASTSTRTTLDPTLECVAMVSEAAPPDHLLFLANDLFAGNGSRLRKSPRFLYDTICSFRSVGAFSPEYGLTYNLSETGIYVRTLDPPPDGARLWLELSPPGLTSTAHLRGKLVWLSVLGKGARSTPPGFGLQIDEENSPAGDLELYRHAYYRLAAVPNKLAVSWRP